MPRPRTTPPRTVDEHTGRVTALVAPLPVVALPLDDAAGAVLAAPLVARADVPPFANAAMDGYAVRADDVRAAAPGAPVTLRVVADVAAGVAPTGVVGPGEAARIMTGAPVPDGADAVVPVEDTSTGTFAHGPLDPAHVEIRVLHPVRPGRSHVRDRAEDVAAGSTLAAPGTVVTARLVALAASVGLTSLPVHRTPHVTVVSTGSELAAVPGPGQIPDSNSYLLAASARAAGAVVDRRGAVPDTADALAAALDAAASTADLVVTSGGVSAGALDVVRHLLTTHPAASDADVAAVGMQPGKPQVLARWRGVPVIAVPGNPVAAFVSSELFVRPAIDRLRGLPAAARATVTRAAGDSWTSPPGRLQVVPVVHDDAERVTPVRATSGGSGSHRASVLARADALALVPEDVTQVRPGDRVEVVLLD
ncbi:molybdopterin molybdotransferase [Sediminihabitans luteus]|uniref:Molybdopterin molybdenumtransferase n=1 Tax=Sediminihabitans luteus TaxID=1138585 RepID=A0A2M9CEZ6_9CELL|nr:gephyrin-like molybdotransferase Glp [Sediminihabitans luteus]PJJ70459.1 molybdopterin molybdotransferase [Sediminihabitans luteus]GII97932.1 molybdopterin molybdenumtransferase MoeA [Sediminihabitans luteus]